MPCPKGKRSTGDCTNAEANTAATPLLTLSHSLVQFLSLLQLQGYVAHLVNECDIHHMDDLAARVTCEQDVEKILGPQASLQHRQEFWRGLCKWKQTTRKRPREVVLQKKVSAHIADIPFVESEANIEKASITNTSPRFAQSKEFTPSQFMRRFAFQGYEDQASPTRDNGKQQVEQQEKGSELHTSCHDAVDKVAGVEGPQEGKGTTAGVVQLSMVSSTVSSLWSTSGGGFSQAGLGGNAQCDRLPLAVLAVGSGRVNAEENIFAEEWGFNNDPEEKGSEEKEPAEVRKESDPAEEVIKEKDDMRSDDGIEQCRAEYVQLQENLRATLESVVAAYNNGLQDLQKRIRSCINSNPTALVRPSILEVTQKPALRISLDHAVIESNGVSNSTHVLLESHNNVRTASGRHSDGLRLSFVDQIVLSPPSAPSFVESMDVVPTLSGRTTHADGKGGPLIEAEHPRHSLVTSRATLQVGTDPPLTTSLSLITGEDAERNSNPVVREHDNTEMVLPSLRSSQSVGDGDLTLLDSHECAEEEQPNLVSRASLASLCLEEFGLQALSQMPNKQSREDVSGSACFRRSVTLQMAGVVEEEVIDVDALSLTSNEDGRNAVLFDDEMDNAEMGDEDVEMDRTAHMRGYSSPMVMSNSSSSEDELHVPLTQQVTRRQPAVSRSQSVSPPPLSHVPFAPDSQPFSPAAADETTICPTALDWTAASSIAADVRHLTGARLPPGEDSLPPGRPPLPAKPNERRPVPDAVDPVETLTAAAVDGLGYAALRDWCQRLGLCVPGERHGDMNGDEEDAGSFATDCSLARDETSTGWWVRAPHTSRAASSEAHNSGDEGLGDDGEADWRAARRAAEAEEMRESLRVFVARRAFMHTVVPFFLHRLPRFSGGPAYRRLRAADIVQAHTAVTQAELDERRRVARADEANEMACCVLTSLVANAAERIESFAPRRVGCEGGGGNSNGAVAEGLTVYEKLLLMEPTDLQAAAEIVRSDFPFITRHRIETMLDESGVSLDTTRRVYHQPNSQITNDTDRSLNATQRSMASCSPPQSPLRQSQLSAREGAQSSKRQFFAQRGWLRRARGK